MTSTGQERRRETLEKRIAQAQTDLRDLGVYLGPANGTPNPEYDVRLREFQVREGLPTTASPLAPILDDVTLVRIRQRAAEVTAQSPVFPRAGQRTLDAQAALRDLGLYSGPANGSPNPEYDTVLRAFQIREGLPAYPLSPIAILDDMTLARIQQRAVEAKTPPGMPTTTSPPMTSPGMSPMTMPPTTSPGMPPVGTSASRGDMPAMGAPAPATSLATMVVGGLLGLIAIGAWGSLIYKRP